jgi:hypothetical protein
MPVASPAPAGLKKKKKKKKIYVNYRVLYFLSYRGPGRGAAICEGWPERSSAPVLPVSTFACTRPRGPIAPLTPTVLHLAHGARHGTRVP